MSRAQDPVSSDAPSPFQAQALATHASSTIRNAAAGSSAPAASRTGSQGPAPLSSPAEAAPTRGPVFPSPSRTDVQGIAPDAPEHASAPVVHERNTRVVRLLPRAQPIPTGAHASGASERSAPARQEPQRASPEVPAPVHSSTGPGSSPQSASDPRPRSRLTFLPGPEAPSPSAPVSSSRPGPLLVQHVTRGMAPVWEQALQVTPTAPGPSSSTAVRNTFNVNVHLEPSTPQAGQDRRSLEDALVDILRETARRHGLEV